MDYDNPATRTTTRPMPIGELLDAWLALQAGAFRGGHHPTRPQATQSEDRPWLPCPGEAPVLVVGCAGTVGASTLALVIASASSAAGWWIARRSPARGWSGRAPLNWVRPSTAGRRDTAARC